MTEAEPAKVPPDPAAAADVVPPAVRGATHVADRVVAKVRRLPASAVSLLVAAGAGLLLYDLVAVRVGRPAMAWRNTLAHELATRTVDDLWVLLGAAFAALLGLWLLLLALTPGLRKLAPMRRDAEGVRAVLDRRV